MAEACRADVFWFGQFLEPMKRRRKDSIHSYREPSLVPLSEKDKVSRINQAREFGKLALYLWYKGCLFF
jgi:hypothetical protein